jgi:hypothetical protein
MGVPAVHNSGPAAVLAVFHKLTGQSMAGEIQGLSFLPHFCYRELYLTNMLACRAQWGFNLVPWEYVNQMLAHPGQRE